MSEKTLTIDKYEQLVVLHRALMHLKFSTNPPMDAVLLASPMLANTINEVVNVLEQLEAENSNSKERKSWKFEIWRDSKKWAIAVRNAILAYEDNWANLSMDTKEQIALLLLSPHITTSELVSQFIEDVEKAISSNV